MKVKENFIDYVYGSNYSDSDKKLFGKTLLHVLPDPALLEMARVFIVAMNNEMFAFKIRMCYTKENGTVDVERIRKEVIDSDFIEISRTEYANLCRKYPNRRELKQKVGEMLAECQNIIFNFEFQSQWG